MAERVELFDAHVRIGESALGYSLQVSDLLKQMDQLEIARAVICPIRPMVGDMREANDLVAQTVANEPERCVGFARVDPWRLDKAVAELDRAVSQLGLRGLLLDAWEDHFVVSSELVDPVVQRAGELGIPVLLAGGYPNFSHPSQIGALAARHPHVRFIATHGGQLNISGQLLADARAMLASHSNVTIETSAVYRQDYIEDTVAEFGAERVVFGSGAPVFDQRLEVLRVRMAHLSEDAKLAIGSLNLRKLLDDTT